MSPARPLAIALIVLLAGAPLLPLGCAAPPPQDGDGGAPAATLPVDALPPGPGPRPSPDPHRAPGPSGGPLLPEQAAFDVEHVDLRVRVDPERESLDGVMTLTARVLEDLDELVLHLDQRLVAERILVGRAQVSFRHDTEAGLLRATLPAALPAGSILVAEVHYGGQPRKALRAPWDGGFSWAVTPDGRPWIATTCQGEGADLWWPCKDHPSDKPERFDLHVTVPSGLFCASNGTLQQTRDNDDGTTTYHWRVVNPISNYNIALNIAPYEELAARYESVSGEVVPVSFWVLPGDRERGEAFLPVILGDLRSLEELCGPYPFRTEKYGVVQTPHLGMEHQTIIAYGNAFRQGDPPGYDWLHHHELSHEWWGNLVTCPDWNDMWIHEGIGTYMQVLHLERRFGRERARQEIALHRRRTLNQRAVAPRQVMDSQQIYFRPDGGHDPDIYDKGCLVMHTLRWLLGDQAFFEGLRRLCYPEPADETRSDGSQVRFLDTEGVRATFESVSGRELGWFFEVYLRQPALPELVLAREDGALALSWRTALDAPFPLPVPLSLDGERRRVEMPGGQARLELPGDTALEVDPDLWLLMTLDGAPGRG